MRCAHLLLGLSMLASAGCVWDPATLELRLRPVLEGCDREVWVQLHDRGRIVDEVRLAPRTAADHARAETSPPPVELEHAYLTYFGLRDSTYSIRLVEGDREFALKLEHPKAGTGGIQYHLFLAIPRDIRQAWCTAELRNE